MRFIILIFIFTLSLSLKAESLKQVTIEWEALPNAKLYDVEITPLFGPAEISATDKPEWTGLLKPGRYQMRIRARDSRKVPGKWSAFESFEVQLEQVALLEPSNKQIKKVEHAEAGPVKFVWTPVEGAENYLFTIQSADGKMGQAQIVTENELTLVLPVANKYTWKVQALGQEDLFGQESPLFSLTVLGKKLESPKILEEKTLGGVMWSKSEFAESYDFILAKKDPKTGKWKTVKKGKDLKETGTSLDPAWVGSEMLLQVKAKAPLRESSEPAKSRFIIEDINRRPAGLDEIKLEEGLGVIE